MEGRREASEKEEDRMPVNLLEYNRASVKFSIEHIGEGVPEKLLPPNRKT